MRNVNLRRKFAFCGMCKFCVLIKFEENCESVAGIKFVFLMVKV